VDKESKSYQGRNIFRVRYNETLRGVTARTDGWSMEKKILWKDTA
jgi:hypothetical protein